MKGLKYRLGNQPEEYALREDYLGWTPENEDWRQFYMQRRESTELALVNPKDGSKKVFFLHDLIVKDAFPFSFLGEERAINWTHFAIVSDDEASEKFIIPLH